MEKLKNIKIAFIDIDGTLSNSKKEINEETILALTNNTSKGLITVLCSGRNNKYAYDISKKCNASNYIICCNGAEVYDYKNDQHIYSNTIPLNKIKEIWDFCNDNNICCLLNGTDFRYCNRNYYIPENDKIMINDIDEIKDINIFQIVTISHDYSIMKKLENLITKIKTLKIANASNNYLFQQQNEKHIFFDITNKNVSKGNAIKKLLKYLKIKKEFSVGIGDHINDYNLFEQVGFKVAMGNANKQLKEQADYITLSNDENGVSYFLTNFIEYEKEKN